MTDARKVTLFILVWAAVLLAAGVAEARPKAWCGYYLRNHLGHSDPSLNLARNWLVKFPRTQPAPGAVGVWARGRGGHVGKIIAITGPCLAMVHSGNDGGRVRTRERNICNAIGFVRA